MLKVINEYCTTSGQQVNLHKSIVFFGVNLPTTPSEELGGILGMSAVDDLGTYLGVPGIQGRSKKMGLAYVKERILGKIQGWKQSTLSQAEMKVLIKVVAQAILAYLMNIFKFPCQHLYGIELTYFQVLVGPQRGRTTHSLGLQGHSGLPEGDGGTWVLKLHDFNDALLAKQCWRLIQDPNSLWARVLKARYFPHCSFLDSKGGGITCWAWSSLLSRMDLLLKETHWQIMNGKEVRVWIDIWLPTLPGEHILPSGSTQVGRNT